jgi:predicted PurR-regulated permease PerM
VTPAGSRLPDTTGSPDPKAMPRRAPGPWLVGGVALLGAGYLFSGLVLPLLAAVVLAYLFHPVVWWAESLALRRSVAVGMLYLTLAVTLLVIWVFLGARIRAEAVAAATGLPRLADQVETAVAAAVRDLGETAPWLRRFLARMPMGSGWIEQLVEQRVENVSHVVEHAGSLLIALVLVPVFTFFVLRDSRRLIAFVMDHIPPAHIETSVAVWCEIERIIGRYLRGIALDGAVFGSLAALGLWLLGVPYALLLGVFAGVANAVPFVGPILGAAAAGLAALTQTQSLVAAGKVGLFFVALKVVDDAVIQPFTIGRSLHLHPVLLLASVVAGNQAFGVLGMLVAVPTVTVLQEVTRLLLEHRNTLAGTRPPELDEPADAPRVVC